MSRQAFRSLCFCNTVSRYCEACEQPHNLQCLGLNTVDAHAHGPALYSLLYASMLTDVAGLESADFFCADGSPCTG